MGKEHEDTFYALLPKIIRYVCKTDEDKLSTTGITLRITKRPGVSEQTLQEEFAQRWIILNTKSVGSLASNLLTPFGEESTFGDA
jgi:hypothetical protein